MGSNQTVANELNQLLADYTIYAQKLKNYHWNVRGKRFFQLHEEFEELYNHAATVTDGLAERISRIGMIPTATLEEYARTTRLEECFEPPTADQMVVDLVGDIESLNQYTANTIAIADDAGDIATQNLLEDLVETQEENAWMLSSWTQEKARNNI